MRGTSASAVGYGSTQTAWRTCAVSMKVGMKQFDDEEGAEIIAEFHFRLAGSSRTLVSERIWSSGSRKTTEPSATR